MLAGAYLALITSAVALCVWGPRRNFTVILILIIGASASLFHQEILSTISEDAFITFRYSQNLADGLGPVFNSGEAVEGYSNFLLMLLLAAINAVFSLPIPETGMVVGSVFMVLCIALTFVLTREISNDKFQPALIASLLLASSGIFVGWGPSGMETSLFSFLILSFFIAVFKGWPGLAGIIVALATMTRPEGVLLGFVFLFWLLAQRRNSAIPPRFLLDHLIRFSLPIVLLLGIWTIWRISYYGYLLPNPISAKSGMNHLRQMAFGLQYFLDFVSANIVIFVMIGAALLLNAAHNALGYTLKSFKSETLILVFTLGLFTLFYIAIGGDWMPLLRFYAPIVPIYAILIGRLFDAALVGSVLDGARRRVSRGAVFALVAVAAIANLAVTFFNPEMLKRNVIWQHQIAALEEIGHWIKSATPEGSTIATFANGIFSYTLGAEYVVVDVLGLTDEHIARRGLRENNGFPGHLANDWAYVAARQPTIIYLSGQGYDSRAISTLQRREFQENYVAVSLRLAANRPLGQYLNLAVRKDQYDYIVSALLNVAGIQAELVGN